MNKRNSIAAVNRKFLLMSAVIILVVSVSLVFSQTTESYNWLYEGPIYETHPFYYGGTGGGTFKDLMQQIPAIADLGVKIIYLIPVWNKHPYAVGDYFKIDPLYGTEADLRELVTAAHNYGMKIIFDLTTRHAVAGSVPWDEKMIFQMPLAELEAKAKTLGWTLNYKKVGKARFVYSPAACINDEKKRGEVYGKVFGDMVKLFIYPTGYRGPAVDRTAQTTIDYYTKAAKYYVQHCDIDGWRIDAPRDNWNPKLIAGDHSIVKLLRTAKAAMTAIKPEAIMFAENPWTDAPENNQLDEMSEASYSYPFRNDFIYPKIINGTSTSQDLIEFFKNENIGRNRTRARFLETHDTVRINDKNPQLNKPLLVLISTVPGIPMIQAGQEIGAKNVWMHQAYLKDPDPKVDWAGSDYALRDFYKKVFTIRAAHPALKYGGNDSIADIWKSSDNVYAYSRTYEAETVVVAINFKKNQAHSVLNLPFSKGTLLTDELSDEVFRVDNPASFKITVPAYGSRILTIKK